MKSVFLTLVLVLLTGCASHPIARDRGDTVSAQETRRAITPVAGIVRDAMPARIAREAERSDRMAGAAVGASAGALLAQRGKRSSSKTALLATLGAVTGEAIVRRAAEAEEAEQVIVEITEGKDRGKKMAVVQQPVDRPLQAGEAIWITVGPKTTRVVRRQSDDGVRSNQGAKEGV